MSLFKKKQKLPQVPKEETSQNAPQPQGGREAIEVDGMLVWVDSSKTSEPSRLSEAEKAELSKQRRSEMRRKLGLPEE